VATTPLGKQVREALRTWALRLGGPDAAARLEKLAPPRNEYGVDPYGFDIDYAVGALAPLLWLYRHYFRCVVRDIEKVPGEGRVLLVSNHSGQIPLDGAMIACALFAEADPPRVVRSMVEKWVPTLPFVSTFMARCGQIVGTPENCRRLLSAGEAILVFPEGIRGINKLWKDRYQLQEFGNGFVRLALETDTPIVPVGVVGAEEQAPALLNLKPLAKLLSMPAFPVTPTLLPVPLPSRYHIYFGDPIRLTGSPDDEDAELERRAAQVREAVNALLRRGLSERKHIFW
jgi:1-acyl-sn-glycerol-3-phosphate acyltransferase